MSATSVGQIGLDLVVNQKQFNKQMTGIQSLANKAGKALAAAFAVKKVVEFGNECLKLGSDLQEVQNVVDVTFPNMSARVDEFAKNAASAFGLSETMAKQYTGTLGSMAKAFGFSEEQAYNMGSTLTGLAGDVASFYNLSQDEAYTKLKSVFTGETESLKDLGVVMTQTALDSYAMANGFGKTTSAMSEAEKVALRYAFVQDRLSAAQGDFARTSESWANQTKVLSLQFESLKATIGQGLIAAFTPVIRVVNALLQKVQGLATAFKDMMEGIFGSQSTETDVLSNAAKSAAEASALTADCTGTTAENLKKASKFLAGFDVVDKISENDSNKTGTENLNIGSGAVSNLTSDAGESSSGVVGKLQSLISYIRGKFTPQFEKTWSKLSRRIRDFKDNCFEVFEDLETLVQPFTEYLAGPFLSSLETIVETARNICTGLFDSFNNVFIDIWDIAAFPLLEKLITQWLPLFSEFSTLFCEFSGTVFDELKSAFDMVWEDAGSPLLENLTTMFMDLMSLLQEFWDNYGEPIFQNLQIAVENTGTVFQTQWDSYLKPMFDSLMETIDEIWNGHLSPFVANFLEFVGELVNGALEIYNEFITPIRLWLVEHLAPVFNTVFRGILEFVSWQIDAFIDCVNGIITSLKGIVQFIAGVFTGDWKKAWLGIKNIFKGVFDSLIGIARQPINIVIDSINGMISGIVSGVNSVIRAVNTISFDMPDWLGGGHVGFNLKEFTAPRIPKLAEGGFVKKNTPQLAMIGDNRHQGEVVAPEDKLTEMAMNAVRTAQGNDYSAEILKVLKDILAVLKTLDLDIVIDGKKLKDIIVEKINQHTRQTGVCEIIT